LITNETHFDLDAKIREYVLSQKRTTIANQNLQEMKSQNKSKSLYIIGDVSYYTRTSLIFYNNETKAISNIVVKDVKSTKSKRELNVIDDEFEIKLANRTQRRSKMSISKYVIRQ